jgi:hypothetical protein
VEEKAQALCFSLGQSKSGYELKGPTGVPVLGEGQTASLKAIDAFLNNHIKTKASALGLRLSTKERQIV